MENKKQLLEILFMFSLVIILGTAGYFVLLDVSLLDALYMTVITISTVGYSEVGVMTPAAKFFSILIIFMGVGTAGYAFTKGVIIIIEGGIRDLWRNRRMDTKISKLHNHYILCGAGETGNVIIEQFQKKNVPFVVIEKNENVVWQFHDKDIPIILGDATEECVLEKARIKEARGLISSLPKDVDNLYTVLTARQLNTKLYIISRSIDKNSPSKLIKAGANNTISANEIGGRRMATLMMRPSVISFLDVITHAGEMEFNLEDIVINDESEMIGKTLGEIKVPEKFGLIVLAIKKSMFEKLIFNPGADFIIAKGDNLLVLGREKQVMALREFARDNGERSPYI